ncbi:MAG TPA: AraD1 family protein [Geminicoccaceae bacterium]
MLVMQFETAVGERRVGRLEDDGRTVQAVAGPRTLLGFALEAARGGERLERLIGAAGAAGPAEDVRALLEAGRVLPPLDHPDPAHCLVTGTGLTHIGSAQARDAMHQVQGKDEAELSDSMKMFRLGIEGGKPAGGGIGVAPEWFYKGDGSIVVRPGAPLPMPAFALDGGEEAEIALLYVIDDERRPCRVGYALGNEFADHVLERQNYLYLAHSKLRACAFGPAVLLGDLPDDVRGTVRVRRGSEDLFEAEFQSGEANMSHSLANLEHHHFKYPLFRRPGDVHVHFIGAPVLSFTSGIRPEPGDVFEVSSRTFGPPLANPLARDDDEGMVRVRAL